MTYSVKHLKISLQLAFTKDGISMFASVFKSKIARLISIAILPAMKSIFNQNSLKILKVYF